MTSSLFAGLFLLVYTGATVWMCRGYHLRIRDIAFSGLCCAMMILLTYIRIPLPIGTAITFEYLPLILLALLYDRRLAMISGLACGVLAALVAPGWEMVHWAQLPLEHLVCFSCLGYAAIFGREKNQCRLGILLAMAISFLGHVCSGAVFFGQYAWAGWGAWGYSLAFNASYMIPNCIVALLLVPALPLDTLARTIQKGAHP